MKVAVVAILAVAIVLSARAESCGKGEVCPEGECCMLSGNRYATPICRPLQPAGESCRPNAKPDNYTLSSSPFEVGTLYTGVYWAVCPCQQGLLCADGTCL